MPKNITNDYNEPDELSETDNDDNHNLTLKQINFIKNDNCVNFMINIMKIMKRHKLDIDDINTIIDDYKINENKKQAKNEARRLKKCDSSKISNCSSKSTRRVQIK